MGRKIIFAFITYSLIISFTLGFISLFALKNTLENLINKHLIQTKIMANSLDFIIQNNLNRLYDISLSGSIDLKNNLDDEKLALKNAYTYSLFSEGILLLDNNGKIITGYPEVYTYIKTISFRKYINKVSYYKKPLITPLYYIRDISKNLIFAMLPFRDSVGNINGIICGIINIAGTQINEFFNVNNILMNHNLLQLIDNTGNTIYSSVKQKKYDNLLHSKYIIKLNKNIQNNKYGIFKIKNKDTQICTYASLQYAPWKIISCQASKVVYNPVKYLLNFFILITTIYILTGLIFATGLSKGIISPVRSLIDETKAIAAGDLSKELNTAGGYEIDELAQSFENMRKKLKESIESIQSYNEKLESMVLERTEELEKNKNKIESLLGLIMSSQEEERKRIARELHDEPLQNLSVILMQLNHLKQLQSTTSNEKIEEIKALILKTNSDIRLIIQNLRPTILDDLGLISAIKWVLENNLKSQGINYFFDYDNNIEDMRFSPFIEINVYRILQEVITNICKHAQAKEVHIKLVVNQDTLIVNIIDDGVGFDVNKILSQDINRMSDLKGIGLLGIYERASLLDGKISIMSKINSGTNITIVIPLNEVSVG